MVSGARGRMQSFDTLPCSDTLRWKARLPARLSPRGHRLQQAAAIQPHTTTQCPTCSRSPILVPVSWEPSRPASGEVLGPKIMARVGGSIWPVERQRDCSMGEEGSHAARACGEGTSCHQWAAPPVLRWHAWAALQAGQMQVHPSDTSTSQRIQGDQHCKDVTASLPGGSALSTSSAATVSAMPAAATPAMETMSPATACSSSTARGEVGVQAQLDGWRPGQQGLPTSVCAAACQLTCSIAHMCWRQCSCQCVGPGSTARIQWAAARACHPSRLHGSSRLNSGPAPHLCRFRCASSAL